MGLSVILLVGAEFNLMPLRNILDNSYTILEARDGYLAENIINHNSQIAAILIDIDPNKNDFKYLMNFLRDKKAYAELPVIALIDQGAELVLNQALAYGIADYLTKPYHTEAVRIRLGNLLKLRIALKNASNDSLTQLLNRTAFQNIVDTYLVDEISENLYAAMVMIDIDRFKQINDTKGHAYGDNVLIEFANVLRSVGGKQCYLARLGGDEFIILLKDIPSLQLAETMVQQIMDRFSNNLCWCDTDIIPTCSIGISFYPIDGHSRRELYFKADEALYQAKQLGRNRYVAYQTMLEKNVVGATDFDQNAEKINDLKRQLELYRSSRVGGVFSLKLDKDLTLLYGNDKYYKIQGYTKESMLVQLENKCRRCIHPDDLAKVRKNLDLAVQLGERYVEFVMRVIKGDQQICYIMCSGVLESVADEMVLNGVVVDITEQKKIEQALRESEEKFRIATKNSNLLFWIYDIQAKKIIQSESSLRYHSRYPRELLNVPESVIRGQYIREDCVASFVAMYKKLDAGEKSAGGEFWLIKDDGSWWCERIEYTTVFDENGKPLRAYAVGIDITEKKLLESRYQEELAYRQAIAADNLILSMRVNLSSDKIEEAKIADPILAEKAQKLNYTAWMEMRCKFLSDREQKSQFMDIFSRETLLQDFNNNEKEKLFEYQTMMADGHYHWISATIKLFSQPNTANIIAFIYSYDIENKKLLQQLMEKIVSADYDYVISLDAARDSYVMFGNTNGTSLPPSICPEYELETIRYANEYVVVEDRAQIIYDMSLANLAKQLSKMTVYVTYANVIEYNGEIRRKKLRYMYIDREKQIILLTRCDITDEVNIEKLQKEALQSALQLAEQANSAKTEFLSRMSHEIRTPMNAIIGMSALAEQCINEPEEVADCLAKVGISARFLLSLINDILDMSRIESGKVCIQQDNILFAEFINEINTINYVQAREKAVKYECVIAGSLAECYIGDALKLQQVINNLLANAVKFTPRGGKVQLIIQQIKQVGDLASMKFTIKDTGIGISEAFKPHIFEAFAQQHIGNTALYGGTGLGLAICKNLVKLMNGTIDFTSTEGVGTEFSVTLKLQIGALKKKPYYTLKDIANKPCKAIPVSSTAKWEQLSGKRILLVEDNVLNIEVEKSLLLAKKILVEVAENGLLAIDAFAAAPVGYFDAILMDICMPVMDGLTAATLIRKMQKADAMTVPIIAVTANAFDEDIEKAKAAGMNAHLSKPLEMNKLFDLLNEFILEK